ncbi:MFS transporter [Devosia sp. PTR5]|uniref:MFS transporter n=1 Tax=Devosia oryzisoli TaxID=2774138 RepID=A0A927FS49_9HYPH|nr:MFS transporter [Devosia oryzisoli]MBD8065006.1 MFS transporter [Devosia oryzisoli]
MSDLVEGRWREIFGPRYLAATVILCLGVSLFAFNAFLSTTALPSAVKELNGVEVISWATTLYLVFAIMGGSAAAMAKARLGSRGSLLLFGGIFLVGTLVAASGGSMTHVLIGRAVQGLGEGVVAALCFSLIPELFPNRLVPKVFGMQAVIWAVAAFGGPAAAGALTEFVSWRAAFLVNVPLIIIFAVMVLMVVPKRVATEDTSRFPGLRLLTIGGGILLVALAAIAPAVQAALLLFGAVVLLGGTVALDRRSDAPLLPTGAFGARTALGAGFWVVLLMPIAGATSGVYLVLLLQQLWGYGPTLAGAVGAVMAVAWSLSSVTVANVRRRETRKILIRTGPVLIGIGLLGVLAGLELGQPVLLLAAQVAIGAGFGISSGYLSLLLMEAAPEQDRNRTTTLIPTTQSAGNAIGAALAGVAANGAGYAVASSNSEVLASIVPLFLTGFVAAALAALAARHMLSLAPAQTMAGSFATE